MSGEVLMDETPRPMQFPRRQPPLLDIDLAIDDIPDVAALEEAACAGLSGLRLGTSPIDISPDGDETRRTLKWLRLLRDCTACGLLVDWQAGEGVRQLSPLLYHVTPPQCDEDERLASWRNIHRFGIFYWRSGPEFISIIDRRNAAEADQFTLETAEHRLAFTEAENVVSRSVLFDRYGTALTELEQEGLILSVSGWSLTLPFRMRHWPVPYSAI